MNELMLHEMLAQPADLAAALVDLRRQVREMRSFTPTKVVLTGSGDSGYAAAALEHAYARSLSCPVWAFSSATAARYGHARLDGLTVAISISGEVRRTIEAAMAARNAGGDVVAITTAPASSLAELADATIVLPTPISRATPHTRDYTLTLLGLLVLLEHLARVTINELDAWPDQVDELLPRARAWADGLSLRHAASSTPVWFLGMGPDRGTAAYGALKFWEAGGSAAGWDDMEEFGHGSQLVARYPELAVLLAVGPARTRAEEMIPGLRQMGMGTAIIGHASESADAALELPDIRPELSPLLTTIPPQALAHAFATQRGIDVALPLGGSPLGVLYEAVHLDWMRESRLEPTPPPA